MSQSFKRLILFIVKPSKQSNKQVLSIIQRRAQTCKDEYKRGKGQISHNAFSDIFKLQAGLCNGLKQK